jgi:hypothetical protein
MDERYYGLAKLLLFGVLAVGFGFQQLWSLKRAKEKTAREKAESASSTQKAP